MVAEYDGYSHEELYQMLHSGDPAPVESTATIWRTIASTAADLARDLERDLGQLAERWTGAAGAEYAVRLTSIVTFSRAISGETGRIGGGLEHLAQLLREAQAKVEDPASTDDRDKTTAYAATGVKYGALAGPAGMVVGGITGAAFGWVADDDEAEKAKARAVAVLEELAANYEAFGLVDRIAVPMVPTELPQGTPNATATAGAAGATAGGLYSGTTQVAAPAGAAHAPAPARAGRPGSTSDVPAPATASTGPVPAGTGLAGAGDGGFTSADLGAPNTGGFSAAQAPVRGLGADGTGLGGFGGRGAGFAGAGARGGGLAGMATGPENGAPSRGGELGAGRGAQNPPPAPINRAATAARDDAEDERLTWLTEDEMAWGGDQLAPPAVLGRAQSQ